MPAEEKMPRRGQLLLDTCAVLWLAEGASMRAEALQAVEQARQTAQSIWIAPISIWEIGLLMARGRITSSLSPHAWVDSLLAHPLLHLAPQPPTVLIDASWLSGQPPADPADRLIIATARHFGLTIITRDRKILDYADAGLASALRC